VATEKNTILVTGGIGYIGSHTVVALLQQGFDVVIVDNLCNSSLFILDRIKKISGILPRFYQVDCCDKIELEKVFEAEKSISASIHFAALKAVGESVNKPLLYYKNNLISLMNLVELQLKYEVSRIVFSSSCTVYGEPDALPVTELSPVKIAASPYGNTKQIGEEILFDTTKVSNLKAIALRYFNPVGAHESALIGELPNGTPNNLVPYITQTAIGKQPFLKVFGNDYNTPDGTCIRDYIHVDDVAAAHVSALNRLLKVNESANFELFNIGTGTGNTVLEVIHAFEEATGVSLPYQIYPRRGGDIEKVYANTDLSNKTLNWTSKFNLKQMMASSWEWEKQLAKNNNYE
jgi:UDP-glucose 4-epimerase